MLHFGVVDQLDARVSAHVVARFVLVACGVVGHFAERKNSNMRRHLIALIPGDGIGKEVVPVSNYHLFRIP